MRRGSIDVGTVVQVVIDIGGRGGKDNIDILVCLVSHE